MKEQIKEHLLNNQEYYKELLKPYKDKRDFVLSYLSMFDDVIDNQYQDICKKIILDDITKRLALNTESVMIELEDLNIETYLKDV